jgi:hypothetical protein
VIELKAHVLKVQRLENAAAERAGLRVRLLDEARLLGRRGAAYAGDIVEALLRDIVKEIGDAAELGLELAKSVESHGQ